MRTPFSRATLQILSQTLRRLTRCCPSRSPTDDVWIFGDPWQGREDCYSRGRQIDRTPAGFRVRGNMITALSRSTSSHRSWRISLRRQPVKIRSLIAASVKAVSVWFRSALEGRCRASPAPWAREIARGFSSLYFSTPWAGFDSFGRRPWRSHQEKKLESTATTRLAVTGVCLRPKCRPEMSLCLISATLVLPSLG